MINRELTAGSNLLKSIWYVKESPVCQKNPQPTYSSAPRFPLKPCILLLQKAKVLLDRPKEEESINE
ncbi:hypothetical protein M8J75_004599 [Diaphorina citri]|nr:hypothetical protein M8J75_004599 [Diaphorina citri]KAI5739025.1 hypothetical protein M8J77_013978 [Diaphorina citri]